MSRPVTSRRRESQGGYVLLMVFLMAAIIALMLYQQLPRVAFESERDKEQLLIDRGEQYVRAIQLYYVANNRQYPTSIDDLEKREKRFLRRRYIDPYTGKDEWRIIHTNGGFLTDSLVKKPPATGDDKSQSASNSPGSSTGSPGSSTGNTNPADQQPQVNAAVLQRPSDRPVTPTPGFAQPFAAQDPNAQASNAPLPPITLLPQQGQGALAPITLQPQQGPGALPPITLQPGGTNQPGGLPPITLAAPGTPGGQQVPGQGQFRAGGGVNPVVPLPGQPGVNPLPGQLVPGGLPGGVQTGVPPGFRMDTNGQLVPITPVSGQPPQGIPGQPQGIPGQPQGFPGQPQGIPGQPQDIPGQPISPQPPGQPNQPDASQGSPNAALNLINQLLTNPRQTTSTPVPSGGNQIGAIAGIASTHKGPSIKIYKDQSQYQLWEFVFDPTASTVPGAAAGGVGAPGMAAPGMGPGGPGQPGAPGTGAPSTFGPSGTFSPSSQSTFGAGPGR